ncbi:hypothetical protein [Pseudomonas sp. 2FG]|uniref:hypothetical protein n=1 Tax=Pseudomonas sp. 2FG TaxID=2502191 RepID=UPI0010F75672|nr:hypothetical protein [Pseudomonas sp. 2FG]
MEELVFVYNGDSGLVNGVMHYLHKRISPDTYSCQLCGIIYDGMSVKQEWLAFVKSLGVKAEFLHRDEYRKRYGESAHDWPAVLLHDGQVLKAIVLSAQDFEAISSLDVLKQKLGDFVSREFPDRSPHGQGTGLSQA